MISLPFTSYAVWYAVHVQELQSLYGGSMEVQCIYCQETMEVPEGDPTNDYAHARCFDAHTVKLTEQQVEDLRSGKDTR